MYTSYRIRTARLPDDKPAILGFIMGMQHFERAIEANRRIDSEVAEEFYAVIVKLVGKRNGRILVAEGKNGDVLGWAAAYEDESETYVHADERVYGYCRALRDRRDARTRYRPGADSGL